MEKEVRFRILNKTSKTVTVKLDKPMTFSWEEFNKKLVVVDKFWAILNEAEKKKQKEADDLVNDAVICVMLQRGNAEPIRKLSALGHLATITEKLQELLECTNMEVLQLIRQRLMLLNPFMVNPMFDEPTGNPLMTEEEEESQKEYEDECDEYRQIKDKKGHTGAQFGPTAPTFGDAFSQLAELKEKLSK